jgi:hypothetical protein
MCFLYKECQSFFLKDKQMKFALEKSSLNGKINEILSSCQILVTDISWNQTISRTLPLDKKKKKKKKESKEQITNKQKTE